MHVEGIHPGTLSGIYPHDSFPVIEPELGTAKPEVLCCIHELEEAGDTEFQRVQVEDLELLETGGSDPGNEWLQISDGTSEPKPAKVGECDSCSDWSRQESPVNREVDINQECLEMGHE